MTKKTFSGEIDRFGMTRIQFTLPGSKHHAAATLATLGAEAGLRIAQDQGLRRGLGRGRRPASRRTLLKICSSALHFGSATI
ncbi:hypothetical protein ACVOMS_09525 [Bradyrhizobium guangxiense]